jgi:hypothetical protein
MAETAGLVLGAGAARARSWEDGSFELPESGPAGPRYRLTSQETTASPSTFQEIEMDGPIYVLACDCDALLDDSALQAQEIGSTARASLDEYRRRFQAWSKYCGVFAEKTVNLDYRVRKKPRIQDIIVR